MSAYRFLIPPGGRTNQPYAGEILVTDGTDEMVLTPILAWSLRLPPPGVPELTDAEVAEDFGKIQAALQADRLRAEMALWWEALLVGLSGMVAEGHHAKDLANWAIEQYRSRAKDLGIEP